MPDQTSAFRRNRGRLAACAAGTAIALTLAACGSSPSAVSATSASVSVAAVASTSANTSAAASDSVSTAAASNSVSTSATVSDSVVASTAARPSAAQFQATIDKVRATVGFPGAVVGVWGPGGASWVGTTGTAGEGIDRAPSPADHTRVGSLTKTMTATVLLQLLQEKRLSLDDPISKYVKGVPNGDATLLQLADMTSGIPVYTAQPAFLPAIMADPARGWTPDELLGYIKNVKPDAAPGAAWNYNNSNYLLLGMVIEKVTGQPIAEVFKKRLFDPLGMTQTSFPGPSTKIASPYLSGVTAQGQPTGKTANPTNWNPSFAFTAGEVISTFGDLKKWSDALFTGKGILDPATQKLHLDSTANNPLTHGYGIGIGNMGGWWGHDGQIFGYTTSVFHSYQLDTTIIIVANSDAPQPGTDDKPVVAAPALLNALKTLVS